LQPAISVLVAVLMMALQLLRESYVPLSDATLILSSPLQSENAPSPMEVTELPMVTEVSPLQYSNASLPMEVTELGMVTEISPLQPLNAQSPMVVTELGMMTDVSPLQSANTLSIDNQQLIH